MSAGRWIRLSVGWNDSDWIATLEPASRLAWIHLLCDVKAKGARGGMKVMPPKLAARRWDVPVKAVERMLDAAKSEGAIAEVDGVWEVTKWKKYQHDETAAERMRRYRERSKPNGHG
jgi:hypothetical protein